VIRHSVVGDAYDDHILTRRQVQREIGEIRKTVDGLGPNELYDHIVAVRTHVV
jgi:hypothetical protein